MPTSASATPKRSPFADRLAAIPPIALLIGIAVAYLALDIARHGPAWQLLRDRVVLRSYLAATVNGEPLSRKQLDLAVEIFLASRGQTSSSLPSPELRAIQLEVLDGLINDVLLRQASIAAPANTPADWANAASPASRPALPLANFRRFAKPRD